MDIKKEKEKLEGLERELKTEVNLFRGREIKKAIKVIKTNISNKNNPL
jgi:hypothetical protein